MSKFRGFKVIICQYLDFSFFRIMNILGLGEKFSKFWFFKFKFV